MNKVYAFINGPRMGGVFVVAVAEDGEVLAGHASSNEAFARHDIGLTSDWKHDKYRAKYPEGYAVVWLDGEKPDDLAIIKDLEEKSKELMKAKHAS